MWLNLVAVAEPASLKEAHDCLKGEKSVTSERKLHYKHYKIKSGIMKSGIMKLNDLKCVIRKKSTMK